MSTGTAGVLKAHVALNVSHVERSIEFYRKMLGIEPRPFFAAPFGYYDANAAANTNGGKD